MLRREDAARAGAQRGGGAGPRGRARSLPARAPGQGPHGAGSADGGPEAEWAGGVVGIEPCTESGVAAAKLSKSVLSERNKKVSLVSPQLARQRGEGHPGHHQEKSPWDPGAPASVRKFRVSSRR